MPILVPVINALSFRPLSQATVIDGRQGAKGLIDAVGPGSLLVTVDGQPVAIHRATSPTFTVLHAAMGILPRGWLTLPGNAESLVSDGCWVDVTYKLTVTQ